MSQGLDPAQGWIILGWVLLAIGSGVYHFIRERREDTSTTEDPGDGWIHPEPEPATSEEQIVEKPEETKQVAAINKDRPKTFDDYVGQEKGKKLLKMHLNNLNGDPMPHLLFWGPAGTGKTTLAYIVSRYLSKVYGFEPTFIEVTPKSLQMTRNLEALLWQIKQGGWGTVVFIDEIHGLPLIVEEALYSALDDFRVTLREKDGMGGERHTTMNLPPFTMIGATTERGDVSRPLASRMMEIELENYTMDEMVQITQRRSYPCSPEAIQLIAERSLFWPRRNGELFNHCRAMSQESGHTRIEVEDVEQFCLEQQIDKFGLGAIHHRLIQYFIRMDNRPKGQRALAQALDIPEETLIEVVEPPLIQKFYFLEKTTRGRRLTPECLETFGAPELAQRMREASK